MRALSELRPPLTPPCKGGEAKGMKKINLAIFASTKGTDLQAIIDAKKSGSLDKVSLKFVLSDKKDSGALEKARNGGIKDIFLDPKGKKRKEYDRECLRICKENNVDLILLIGYMRIISSVLIESYKNRIINIHPSLLPKYPGMDLDVHKAVLEAGEKETGCTLYFIDEGVDTGRIISQERVAILHGDTPKSLKKRVQEKEQEVILKGLSMLSGKL